jgi:hypothetical protein
VYTKTFWKSFLETRFDIMPLQRNENENTRNYHTGYGSYYSDQAMGLDEMEFESWYKQRFCFFFKTFILVTAPLNLVLFTQHKAAGV